MYEIITRFLGKINLKTEKAWICTINNIFTINNLKFSYFSRNLYNEWNFKFRINLHRWIQSRIRFEAWRFHISVQSKIESFSLCFQPLKNEKFHFSRSFSTRQLCDFKLQCLFSVKAIIIFSSSWEIVLGNSTTKKKSSFLRTCYNESLTMLDKRGKILD